MISVSAVMKFMRFLTHVFNSMDLDAAKIQYAPAESDEQKNCMVKKTCFDCSQKRHLHKNCSMNLYSKIQFFIITFTIIFMNTNSQITLTARTYAFSVIGE